VIGVAVDIQGVDVAKPWYDKHMLSYPTLVDAHNALGRAIGFKVIPNQFYVDELGVFHGRIKQTELTEKLARPMQPVPAELRRRARHAAPNPGYEALKEQAKRRRTDFAVQLAAGRAALAAREMENAVRCLKRACALQENSVDALMAISAAYLTAERPAQAADALRAALKIDPENWIVHKQIWAIEHPERFYGGDVDFSWQREQLRAERESQRDASP